MIREVSTRWTVDRFLKKLSSAEPAPGGGSAAAVAAALGASLGSMVGAISLSRPKISPAEKKRLKRLLADLEKSQRSLRRLVKEDALVYRRLVEAQRKGRGLHKARRNALACPLQIFRESKRAMRLLREIGRKTGPYLGSDIQAGIALLRGACEAAEAMVEVNRK